MFARNNNFANTYKNVERETGVHDASPYKLILMLFEGALLAVANASRFLDTNDVPQKGQAISRAINIISNGLDVSLNKDDGGELAERLSGLYDYMCMRLLHANLHNDQGALDEVSRLLAELRDAWEEIAKDPAVVSHSRKLA